MTQVFDEKGDVHPITVLQAGPCVITQLKTLKIEKHEGRYDEAIIMANKVMNVETENVELHEIMAEIYTRKSMKAKVIDEYTKLSNLYEKHGRIEDAIKIRQVLSKIKMI
jgi:ribosomal protein L3